MTFSQCAFEYRYKDLVDVRNVAFENSKDSLLIADGRDGG